MSALTYPAFQKALEENDKETLFRLYDLEHQLRARAEAQTQALLWSAHHGSNSRAAEPGYLASPPLTDVPKPKLKDPKPQPKLRPGFSIL